MFTDLAEDKVIGIVGGMGPQAGHSLFDKIIRLTEATSDQQHLSVVLMSFPKYIEDRTAFLQGLTRVNPAINIVRIIRQLEHTGATIIGIPCNTSHAPAIFDIICKELAETQSLVKLVHMPTETCQYIAIHHKGVRRVGLMTTNGTYKTGLYKNLLMALGYEVVIPDFDFQNEVIHKMIYDPEYGIKACPNFISPEVRVLQEKALCFFKENRSDAVILGCTELPLVLTESRIGDMLLIDPTDILARALVREATHKNEQ
jgi:aspartate racemase